MIGQRTGSEPGQVEAVLAELWRGKVAEKLVALDARNSGGDGGKPWSFEQRREAGARLLEEEARLYNTARLRAGEPALDAQALGRVRKSVLDALFGMGPLQELLEDPGIEDIHVNGFDKVVLRYADGHCEHGPPIASSERELVEMVRQLASRSGAEERRFDRAVPMLDLQLADGSRMCAVMEVTRAVSLTIRKHRMMNATLDELREGGMFDDQMQEFLRCCVLARRNVLIAGGPANGKTTLLRAMGKVIPPWEKLVTVEDVRELNLDSDGIHHNVVAMQTRPANIENAGAIDQSDLLRLALRMSPDRVIVGEIRGPEVVQMFAAMSQGNAGSLCSIHASDSHVAFARLASYAALPPAGLSMQATSLMTACSVHFVVQLGHDTSHRRCVTSVREIVGHDGHQVVSNEVFRPGPDRRAVRGAPLRPQTRLDFDEVTARP